MKELEVKEYDYNENIIRDLGLTEMQVLNIISEAYVNGMIPNIVQSENGLELDELADKLFYELFEEEELIRNIKL